MPKGHASYVVLLRTCFNESHTVLSVGTINTARFRLTICFRNFRLHEGFT